MSYHKCSGCHGHNRQRHCHCHCRPTHKDHNDCKNLGPFVAINPKCIIPVEQTGAIIPFSSGTIPAVLVTAVGGLIGTTSLIGFGTSIPGVSVVNNQINLLAPLLSEAFSVPRNGEITSISASFRATIALDLIGSATVNARIYRAPEGSNTFTATDASVNLTPITGPLAVDETISGNSSNFPPVTVSTGDRLLMVFSVTGPTVVTTLTGVASAGINIA